ncbi:MAG: cupin domain-containing protein [Deltaproteobacteria bacterium]|nr:cupin domain-containing protein [Candidatus Deferrimicrobiaceae bacterium]
MGPDEIIAAYRLERHPEGGWFREVYRSTRLLGQIPEYPGNRAAYTAIYFLLTRGDFSAFHRLRSEEVWIHLDGDPLELILLGGEVRRIRLAPVTQGGDPVAVVPSGELQAARTSGDYTLSACIVAPGFEFADFSMPSRDELLREHPDRRDLILEFTR